MLDYKIAIERCFFFFNKKANPLISSSHLIVSISRLYEGLQWTNWQDQVLKLELSLLVELLHLPCSEHRKSKKQKDYRCTHRKQTLLQTFKTLLGLLSKMKSLQRDTHIATDPSGNRSLKCSRRAEKAASPPSQWQHDSHQVIAASVSNDFPSTSFSIWKENWTGWK